MKILIISDAWFPQVNGVVRTLEATAKELARLGHETRIVGPDLNRRLTFALRFYPEIKLEFFAHRRLERVLREFQPDFIHIATEGPLGWAARRLCLFRTLPFTTAYHTRFPEYLAARTPRFLQGFLRLTAYALLRRFHAPASVVMVATASIEQELRARRFRRLVRWSRGVDTNLFRPYGKDLAAYANAPRPVLLYVGRVSVEKNLRAFLDVAGLGSQIVIGDGPDLAALQKQYPDAHFLGALSGEDLARHYAAADLFVFPSTTDTFGLVLLEASAAGLRIAAVPAPGPSDIFADGAGKGFVAMDPDLGRAIAAALRLPDDSNAPRAFAQRFTWAACTEEFFAHLQAPTPKAVRRLTRWRERLARI
ncbi:MAG TPA: glycosyltransferase family 1 protein [Roseiarcus sp.]|nr:glycosyltransferase family 1 protein [Roseiarcus sp.]